MCLVSASNASTTRHHHIQTLGRRPCGHWDDIETTLMSLVDVGALRLLVQIGLLLDGGFQLGLLDEVSWTW